MLIRSSRGAQAFEKDAGLIGGMAKGLLKDVKGFRQAGKMLGPLQKGQSRWAHRLKNWNPTTMAGGAAKAVMKHPLAAAGVVGGTAMAGSGAHKAFQSGMASSRDPYALQRRRMQGFRS